MKLFNKKNFTEVCSFNCGLASSFGFFFFSLDKQKTGCCQRCSNRCQKKCLCLNFLLVVIGMVISYKRVDVDFLNSIESVVLRIGLKMYTQQFICIPLMMAFHNFLNRRRHVTIIENIQSIDDNLHELGIDFNYRKQFFFALAVTGFFNSSLCIFYCWFYKVYSMIEIEKGGKFFFFNVILNVTADAPILNYLIAYLLLIAAIYKRFQYVDQLLTQSNVSLRAFRKLRRIHDKLLDTLNLINSCFVICVLCLLDAAFITLVFNLYSLYHFLEANVQDTKNIIANFMMLFILLFPFLLSVWIITYSKWIAEDNLKIRTFINSMLNRNQKFLESLNLFEMQLQHRKPRISVGLFDIDLKFLFTFISALCSYLIILIQNEICALNCGLARFFGYFFFSIGSGKAKNNEKWPYLHFLVFLALGLIGFIRGKSTPVNSDSIIIYLGNTNMLVTGAIYARYQNFNEILLHNKFDLTLLKELRKTHYKLADTLSLISSCFALNKILSDKNLLKNCEYFEMQMEHSKAEISSGLFTVDMNFLFSFISTVFSYLIILIQFESIV
ncbi:CLUMA_CG017733, isoform A [Clunio marinus]|uniref:Gustatory receptor n=1 Tax=Clunio marinus TaxID=568069 RepID=A0A1J1IWS9_9DIPT|nr:CLUMA_CG017733, isoform A [Clunio marinus]